MDRSSSRRCVAESDVKDRLFSKSKMDILDSTEGHLVKEAESQTIIILHGVFVQKETSAYPGQDILNPPSISTLASPLSSPSNQNRTTARSPLPSVDDTIEDVSEQVITEYPLNTVSDGLKGRSIASVEQFPRYVPANN